MSTTTDPTDASVPPRTHGPMSLAERVGLLEQQLEAIPRLERKIDELHTLLVDELQRDRTRAERADETRRQREAIRAARVEACLSVIQTAATGLAKPSVVIVLALSIAATAIALSVGAVSVGYEGLTISAGGGAEVRGSTSDGGSDLGETASDGAAPTP